ncbi:MAG TPA: glycoside hydrolase family 127 protein [Prolixibacteraceae bacterium]|jgi:hypothetical protein|nr:glycoside hydrolase family 127 protein [Prolixibacteraceae bacterium]HNZ69936.1 glycoside hydrolase family 127 protein [Prolixibacteraceae bacterium]HOC87621.1 glycoside hydrolase family 127 protein [Prolixibacteraceae bacterium]HOG96958.1 glycoside hydrolase family 127 protein [Prolixibacteraceae bacterium]HOY92437.1 glycoside hydrolase family 127 protein [Prolixibacteraceae bacterium]
MKATAMILFFALLAGCGMGKKGEAPLYTENRAPLRANPFIELPLGAIRPEGWLREMLLRQKTGATGHLDELYPAVMGPRNGWLGGDGDQWERGPYWIDGLLPLAWILEDDTLKAKVQPWIEWALQSRQPDGYFGPSTDYPPEKGLQRNNSRDWWPKMVMLKILKQYYQATADTRVIDHLTAYFRYQLENLPKTPLGHWTFWGEFRAADNLMVVYWLYNVTGEPFLLELATLLQQQAFDFTSAFLAGDHLSTPGSLHCVNLAQGFKLPLLVYQQYPDEKYPQATRKGFSDLRQHFGQPYGLYGGDEALHSADPNQGSELCSAVEMMFSLETMLAITGDIHYADHLEKIAFNALPAQVSDDFLQRQYFQQANQVMITRQMRNFDVNHDGTDVCFGLLTGYPCCTSNMHQGWPKFTQNLFYATPDRGVAALVYAPAMVRLKVAGGKEILIREETNYPFEEKITFHLEWHGDSGSLRFPFRLRIPEWCAHPNLLVNGEETEVAPVDGLVTLNRHWHDGDRIELTLPMDITLSTWHENSRAVERGPLVYALKVEAGKRMVTNTKDPETYGTEYEEYLPLSPWNYGLTESEVANPAGKMQVTAKIQDNYPWTTNNAPVEIRARGIRIPSWQLYNGSAGPLPWSNMYKMELGDLPEEEEITLIPYGCTTLRITEFPVIRGR